MLLAIDSIQEHPNNARVIAAPAEADDALIDSMRLLGLLQPVLVVARPLTQNEQRSDPLWELRAGRRRLMAARALGWKQINAVEVTAAPDGDDVPETAISAAENMVRAGMHPVDQWRAIVALRAESGYSLETAAAALGVSLSIAKRMQWLGSMAPELLEAIGTGSLPDTRELRLIAMAPHDRQREALSKARQRQHGFDWRTVAEACTVRRIPMSRAAFDPKLMAWDEDLFAEPDDDARFTTTDIDDFLANQRLALAARIAKGKGRFEINTTRDQYGRVQLPKGWTSEYHCNIPKRWAKDDPRRVFLSLHEDGYQVGLIDEHMGYPSSSKKQADSKAPSGSAESSIAAPKPPIIKKTLTDLAVIKGNALRACLENEVAAGIDPHEMLRAVLLLFTFNNVQAGNLRGSPYSGIAQDLVTASGSPRVDANLVQIAAQVISAATEFDRPDFFKSSGPGAEWLATAMGAQMPRTDTAEILAGVRGETLIDIAKQAGVKTSGTTGALRKRLAGQLPDWRAVSFGAPGPRDTSNDPDYLEVDEGEEIPPAEDDGWDVAQDDAA